MDLLIPSTFAADERDMKLRAVKYGMLARTASIYGARNVIIYKDQDPNINEKRSAELIEKYLQYAECPPYLRKKLIPFDKDLKYANILPALQTISHGYSETFREAVVESNEEGVIKLEAGMKNKLEAYGDHEQGERVTVKLIGNGRAKIIDRNNLEGFWTFNIHNRREKLGRLLESFNKPVIGTSFHGQPVSSVEQELADLDDYAVIFGSAWRGIPDLEERGDLDKNQIDWMVNFVPEQQTKTVRTEEALYICLSVLDYLQSR